MAAKRSREEAFATTEAEDQVMEENIAHKEDGKGISEDEAAIYDRQIRLWGLETQNRMRQASLLLIGLNGANVEVAKNLVLGGVGSVAICDPTIVSVHDLSANFFLSSSDVGKPRASACLERIKELNPRVNVSVIEEDLISTLNDSIFQNFGIVCLEPSNLSQIGSIDSLCRKLHIPFFAVALHGLFGFFFTDHNGHQYKPDKQVLTVSSPSFSDCFTTPFVPPTRANRVPKLYFSLQAAYSYAETNNDPSFSNRDSLLSFAKQHLGGLNVPINRVFDPSQLKSLLFFSF
eukprot:TRINITY_DN5393_c0_g1_i1.p1 TRINITY_DN5393_c0_g1~~TRINITY_DN5393_c0_g1_i1.p1  ORF type:complete len:290 (-),score=142.09 TRINITY_DN5393_c0_g1_i1:220-1089(-)